MFPAKGVVIDFTFDHHCLSQRWYIPMEGSMDSFEVCCNETFISDTAYFVCVSYSFIVYTGNHNLFVFDFLKNFPYRHIC